MSGSPAARHGDPVADTNEAEWGILGAGLGLAAAVFGLVLLPVAAPALIVAGAILAGAGGGALAGMHLGEASVDGDESGDKKIESGSWNTRVEGRWVARAGLDTVVDGSVPPGPDVEEAHPGTNPLVAEGSATVAVNRLPFARVKDRTAEGERVRHGARRTIVGGPPAEMVKPGSEVPENVKMACNVAAWGGLLMLTGGMAIALAANGMTAGWAVSTAIAINGAPAVAGHYASAGAADWARSKGYDELTVRSIELAAGTVAGGASARVAPTLGLRIAAPRAPTTPRGGKAPADAAAQARHHDIERAHAVADRFRQAQKDPRAMLEVLGYSRTPKATLARLAPRRAGATPGSAVAGWLDVARARLGGGPRAGSRRAQRGAIGDLGPTHKSAPSEARGSAAATEGAAPAHIETLPYGRADGNPLAMAPWGRFQQGLMSRVRQTFDRTAVLKKMKKTIHFDGKEWRIPKADRSRLTRELATEMESLRGRQHELSRLPPHQRHGTADYPGPFEVRIPKTEVAPTRMGPTGPKEHPGMLVQEAARGVNERDFVRKLRADELERNGGRPLDPGWDQRQHDRLANMTAAATANARKTATTPSLAVDDNPANFRFWKDGDTTIVEWFDPYVPRAQTAWRVVAPTPTAPPPAVVRPNTNANATTKPAPFIPSDWNVSPSPAIARSTAPAAPPATTSVLATRPYGRAPGASIAEVTEAGAWRALAAYPDRVGRGGEHRVRGNAREVVKLRMRLPFPEYDPVGADLGLARPRMSRSEVTEQTTIYVDTIAELRAADPQLRALIPETTQVGGRAMRQDRIEGLTYRQLWEEKLAGRAPADAMKRAAEQTERVREKITNVIGPEGRTVRVGDRVHHVGAENVDNAIFDASGNIVGLPDPVGVGRHEPD